jgi:hypothetical protein
MDSHTIDSNAMDSSIEESSGGTQAPVPQALKVLLKEKTETNLGAFKQALAVFLKGSIEMRLADQRT